MTKEDLIKLIRQYYIYCHGTSSAEPLKVNKPTLLGFANWLQDFEGGK